MGECLGLAKATIDKKFVGHLDELIEQVAKLDGVKKLMAEDLLEAYVHVYNDYTQLDKVLAKEGLLIDVEKGGANNRRMERVKNPAFDMRRNCISQMADLANKITKFVRDDNADPDDELDEFLNS